MLKFEYKMSTTEAKQWYAGVKREVILSYAEYHAKKADCDRFAVVDDEGGVVHEGLLAK